MSQLFKKKPTIEILNKVLNAFEIDEFKEEYSFRKKDLINWNTVEKLNLLKDELSEYYFPCKAKQYLESIEPNRCITILRQLLRVFNYKLLSKEKYTNGDKFVLYVLCANHHIKSPKEVILKI